MKHFRQFCATILLMLVIAISASAGEMGTPGSNVPPPPPVPTQSGEMGTPGRPTSDPSSEAKHAPDFLTEAAMLFCKSMLSLF